MDKKVFDDWCLDNLDNLKPLLVIKYPKCLRSIDNDLSDFYLHVIEKVLPELSCPKSYLYTYIYNTHYRFYNNKKNEREGYIINNKYCSIKVEGVEFDVYDEEYIEPITHKVLTIIETRLTLDEMILYRLYYEDNLTTRKIAKVYNISHVGVSNQLKFIRNKIKNILHEE